MRNKNGFTVIELMLAMAFLGFILLFVVTSLMQMMRTYNKGLVYKEINQAGRTINEEFIRNVRTAKPGSINVQQQLKGRICVGGQAYIWNAPDTSPQNVYAVDHTPVTGIIRVVDTAGQLCALGGGGALPDVSRSLATILASGTVQVQRFTVQQADNGNLALIDMLLSTTGDNAPVETAGEINCPAGSAGDFCAVADFSTTITTRNRGN